MKKIIWTVVLAAAVVAVALGAYGVGVAFAQDGNPPFTGRGPMMQNGGEMGALHTFMTTEFARKLELNVNDINTRLAAGETMYDIALSAGVTAEEFPAVMTEVRANALAAAVKANVITQEQADWMNSRGAGRGMGTGDCTGTGVQGQNGRGQGMHGGMMGGAGRYQVNP